MYEKFKLLSTAYMCSQMPFQIEFDLQKKNGSKNTQELKYSALRSCSTACSILLQISLDNGDNFQGAYFHDKPYAAQKNSYNYNSFHTSGTGIRASFHQSIVLSWNKNIKVNM